MAVSLSSGMRSALSALQSNTLTVQQTQARLASGKRVGSALDNPANYFRAASLSSRANELSGLLDDMGQAQSVLKATSKGLDSIRSLIDSAKGLVGKALQAGQNNTLTGTLTTALKATDKLVGDTDMTSGKKISISVDGGTAEDVITLDANSTVQDLIDGINSNTDLNPKGSGTAIRASLVGGNLSIVSSSGKTVSIETDDSDTNFKKLLGDKTSEGSAVAAAGTDFVDSTRKTMATQFNEMLRQIDQTIQDSGYGGVNLLQGQDLKVTFNETGSSAITINGVNYTANGEMGIADATNDFISNDDVQAAMANLKRATDKLSAQSSVFASNLTVIQNRSTFTKNMIDTLNEGSDALTMADQNEESTNLLTLNTRQQLAQTTLSLAAQSDAAVTRLF
ncbi:MAG: hypothetical protein ACKOC1_03025 [Hyphomicrobiales bacterium]